MKNEAWVEEYQQMVDDCEARESKMNDWEIGFIDSISNRLADVLPLSSKQIETLESIWEKVTRFG